MMESDEDELPNLADILKTKKPTTRKPPQRTTSTTSKDTPLSRKESHNDASENNNDETSQNTKPPQRRQRPLKRVENNSVLVQPLKVSSDLSRLATKSKRRTPASNAQKLDLGAEIEEKKYGKETKERKIIPENLSSQSDKEDTLDEIEFWSRPRPLKSPPQICPPPETPRAARTKARSFKVPPPLKEAPAELQLFQPQKSTSIAPTSRPTSSDYDQPALLT